jgi:hypothetical protein
MSKGRLVKHSKQRHGALYKQIAAEFRAKGYDHITACEMARDYLELHEEIDGLSSDEDFSRTYCYIRDKETDE